MKIRLFLSIVSIMFLANVVNAQRRNEVPREPLSPQESLEFIATDLNVIAIRLGKLNDDINKAYEKIAQNMGFQITEDQRKIIISFEILNKAEVRVSNLQKAKLELLQKKAVIETKIRRLHESSREDNIDRSVSGIGTTNAEAIRERRREYLQEEINTQRNLLFEIEIELSEINSDLLQTRRIVSMIKSRLFPAIEREIPRLN